MTGDRRQDRTYGEEEIRAKLEAELPHWYYEKGWIRRRYRTSGWKGTLMVINAVGHLAEAAWHHPDITASYAFVIVKLMNHAARGVTEKDFELARKIEEFVHWQPGEEGGSLRGRRGIRGSATSSTTEGASGILFLTGRLARDSRCREFEGLKKRDCSCRAPRSGLRVAGRRHGRNRQALSLHHRRPAALSRPGATTPGRRWRGAARRGPG